ncbi:MAG: ECF transporter S component [Oscillospiraceae bacterium]|nr:ECF transporter S component [Oscillospiraceae bacterium]
MPLSHLRKLIFTAVCAALCIALPVAFHAVPNAGNIFLPLHIPVLLCGLICGIPYGLACGLMGPVLSFLCSGMPPAAALPSMTVECAVYGLVMGLMMRLLRTRSAVADVYISVITAMLAGRILAGIANALIFTPGISALAWVASALVTGIPGICIQLVVIPAVFFALTRARLIPRRYCQEVSP